MKYLILIYSNPMSQNLWNSLSPGERSASLGVYTALEEDLAASGELIMAEALADPSSGKRVEVRDGQTMTTDGPFAEAKEQVAGFYLVECESFERAVEHAARIPEAASGLIEVRAVMDVSGHEM